MLGVGTLQIVLYSTFMNKKIPFVMAELQKYREL